MEERELVVSGAAGLGAAVAAESGTELGELEAIHARGYWELVWSRFKRDRIAVASGVFVILLILVAFVGAPIARHFLGHGPNYLFIGSNAVSDQLQPAGPWTWVDYQGKYGQTHHTLLVLGASNTLGQDEFLRLLYGAQVSLEVALLSTIGVMFVGVLMGSIAGYYRGWVDSIVSKVTEVTMAFPALLFVIVAGAFTFTSLVVTKEMGLGMAVAVLVDATIIRTLLVPATMRLLGRWNWWLPGRPLPSKQEV